MDFSDYDSSVKSENSDELLDECVSITELYIVSDNYGRESIRESIAKRTSVAPCSFIKLTELRLK